MIAVPLSAAGTQGTVSMALLKIAGLNLVLPQHDVTAVEAAADLGGEEPGLRSVGWINHARQPWPVYCLSEELSLLPSVPAGRRACVVLARGNGYMGILCDEISIAQLASVRPFALPDAMKLPGTPIRCLVPIDTGIACVTGAQQLAAHIDCMVAQ
jgi:hypothetical protein